MRNHHDVKEDLFNHRIERWVEAGILLGARDFDDLLSRLPSVYPTSVPPALSALFTRGRLDVETLARLKPSSATKLRSSPTEYSVLPPPHPLDFEWRFSFQTARLLLDRAVELCRPGEEILLFGTPGVALQSLSRPQIRPTTFFGEENSVTRRLILLNREIDCPISIQFCSSITKPRGGASVVILDSPWYLDHIRPMLATAAAVCNLGGNILISLPPDGTRPSAAEDRVRVLMFADRLGLRAVETHALALTYEMPFFEKNALAACGLQVRDFWRRGDLVVFRKVVDKNSPIIAGAGRKGSWREIEIGRMRLLIRHDAASNKGQVLQRLVGGDILPTVSRRDRRRTQVQVWTSGNRVFASSAPDLLITAALVASGDPIDSNIQSSMQECYEATELSHALRALAEIEAKEEALTGALGGNEWSEMWPLTSMSYCNELKGVFSG